MSFHPDPAGPIPEERIAAELERVLARAEFKDDDPLAWLWKWLSANFDAEGGELLGRVLIVVFVALTVVLLFWFVRWRLSLGEAEVERSGFERAHVAQRVAELRRAAAAARRAGDFRLALRLTFFALVVGLGERGDLRYRDAWTNRELLDRGRPSERTRSLLRPLLDDLEAKDFGGEPATEADLDRLERLCTEWLGSVPA